MHRLRRRSAIVWRHGEEGTFAEGTSRGLQGRIRPGRLCISSTDRPTPRPCPCESGIGEGLAARCKVAVVAQVRLSARKDIGPASPALSLYSSERRPRPAWQRPAKLVCKVQNNYPISSVSSSWLPW